eukprot:TRINITY_DN8981_c0_g1_i1.p1 TRINITY_DN8981_c0_g1~~TRINITY_DN8981_c0_g1_i1.p1  ORF type:complete len:709 (+),score=156.63 TRINITY_DN8981_c0_g1_i1:32-2158(+)
MSDQNRGSKPIVKVLKRHTIHGTKRTIGLSPQFIEDGEKNLRDVYVQQVEDRILLYTSYEDHGTYCISDMNGKTSYVDEDLPSESVSFCRSLVVSLHKSPDNTVISLFDSDSTDSCSIHDRDLHHLAASNCNSDEVMIIGKDRFLIARYIGNRGKIVCGKDFIETLKDPIASAYLSIFLRKTYCSENYNAWRAIDYYNKVFSWTNLVKQKEMTIDIMNNYFEDGAIDETYIPGNVKTTIYQNLENGNMENIFDNQEQYLIKTLNMDSWYDYVDQGEIKTYEQSSISNSFEMEYVYVEPGTMLTEIDGNLCSSYRNYAIVANSSEFQVWSIRTFQCVYRYNIEEGADELNFLNINEEGKVVGATDKHVYIWSILGNIRKVEADSSIVYFWSDERYIIICTDEGVMAYVDRTSQGELKLHVLNNIHNLLHDIVSIRRYGKYIIPLTTKRVYIFTIDLENAVSLQTKALMGKGLYLFPKRNGTIYVAMLSNKTISLLYWRVNQKKLEGLAKKYKKLDEEAETSSDQVIHVQENDIDSSETTSQIQHESSSVVEERVTGIVMRVLEEYSLISASNSSSAETVKKPIATAETSVFDDLDAQSEDISNSFQNEHINHTLYNSERIRSYSSHSQGETLEFLRLQSELKKWKQLATKWKNITTEIDNKVVAIKKNYTRLLLEHEQYVLQNSHKQSRTKELLNMLMDEYSSDINGVK